MVKINDSDYDNAFTFFGPVSMAIYEGGNVLDDTPTVKISLSIILVIIMIFGLIGNVCTCAMIARKRSMWTPSNCYLFNLAITDLLMLLFTPMEIYIMWYPEIYPLGEIGCRLHFILWDCASNCSLLIITTFTVERYLVVTKPFLRQKLSESSRVFKIISVIWIISIVFSIPDLAYIDLLEKKKYVFCHVTMSYIVSIFVIVETIMFYVIPVSIILVVYVLITVELKCKKKKIVQSPVNAQNNDKATIMLAIIASTFFLFWSPYCLLRIMVISSKYLYKVHYNVWKILNYLCYGSYLSSALNPILYSLVSRKFRRELRVFLSRTRASTEIRIPVRRNLIPKPICNDLVLREIRLNYN